eukprot:13496572-Alexandrium_andersonii.AAC.1
MSGGAESNDELFYWTFSSEGQRFLTDGPDAPPWASVRARKTLSYLDGSVIAEEVVDDERRSDSAWRRRRLPGRGSTPQRIV